MGEPPGSPRPPPLSQTGGRSVRRYDAVAIGSGINALVAGALLARKGWTVCVLERNDWLGGAIRTAEITEPGFVHEVFASWHPLFTGSAAYLQLRDELEARGVEYLNTELPTATLFPDGAVAVPDHLAPGERRLARARLGADRVGVHAQRRPRVRRPRHGAVVARRRPAGSARAAAARPARPDPVRRDRPHELPRLDGGDVRRRARVGAVRAVGAAHRPRPGCRFVRLHGPR